MLTKKEARHLVVGDKIITSHNTFRIDKISPHPESGILLPLLDVTDRFEKKIRIDTASRNLQDFIFDVETEETAEKQKVSW